MGSVLLCNATAWLGYRLPDCSWATSHALLIKDDRIIAMGDSALTGKADMTVDCDGGFLMAGFADGHVHTIFGGLEREFALVKGFETPQEIVQSVKSWAAQHPDAEWIRGEGFDQALAPNGIFHAAWLDEFIPDRPVFLRASDYHTVWVNSMALERVGYTGEVVQPHDGEIVVDDSGRAIGTLREWGAWHPVFELMPEPSLETKLSALKYATESFAAAGLTWVQDAWVDFTDVGVWKAARAAGLLAVDADLGLFANPNTWREQLDGFVSSRQSISQIEPEELGAARVSCNTIKFFADGVLESGTSAMLEPYCDCPHSRGLPNWDPEEFKLAVAAVDKLGFTAHIHAIGDYGIRIALDSMEYAARVNPPWDRRWVMAHTQLIDPADLNRFVELGVIGNFEPYWSRYDELQERLTEPRLGPERTVRQFQTASLANTGATISFGSDWPVSTFAPLEGICVAVTRQMTPDGPPWIPQERVSVEQALAAYTSGVAFQSNRPDAGVIRPGALADLVLLHQDPRNVQPTSINEIAVLGTWRRGQRTHG
jgi:predicted amidohydrolase YtcJ